MTNVLVAGIVGLLVGAIVGIVAGSALGRHDDGALAWWLGVSV